VKGIKVGRSRRGAERTLGTTSRRAVLGLLDRAARNGMWMAI